MRNAGEIISSLFKDRFGNEFLENARLSSDLFTSWESIVTAIWPKGPDHRKGDIPAAAVHSKIRELERGVLLIEADHPGWIQILQTKQAELLRMIQRRHPKLDIRGIAFMLSQGTLPAAAPAKAPIEGLTEESTQKEPEKHEAKQKDGELYAALKNLEKSYKERNR